MVFVNKFLRNDQTQWVDEIIDREKPDFFIVAESDDAWVQSTNLTKRYPYRASEFDQSVWGLDLFSKFPFTKPIQTDIGVDVPGVIIASVNVPIQGSVGTLDDTAAVTTVPLNLVTAHIPPPVSSFRWNQARTMTRRIATPIRHASEAWIMAGDFNSSPAGRVFQSMMHTAHLKDAFYGFGFQPTWNQEVWFLQTAIDHVLGNHFVYFTDAHTIAVPGSDHRALYSSFSILPTSDRQLDEE